MAVVNVNRSGKERDSNIEHFFHSLSLIPPPPPHPHFFCYPHQHADAHATSRREFTSVYLSFSDAFLFLFRRCSGLPFSCLIYLVLDPISSISRVGWQVFSSFLFFCPPLPPFTVAAAASSVFLFERYYLSAVFDYIYFTVSLLPPPFAPHVPRLRPSYIVVTLLPYLSCCSWVRRMLCFG